ncbi:MAG: GtrA family protein [Gemmatimonadaceae bacterium]
MRSPIPRPSWRTRPFVRFLAVGPLGLTLGAVQFELLWMLVPSDAFRAGSTWIVSSVIGVAWMHALHCQFTFAGTARGRWRATLGRAYLVYAAGILLGTALMHLFVDHRPLQPRQLRAVAPARRCGRAPARRTASRAGHRPARRHRHRARPQ